MKEAFIERGTSFVRKNRTTENEQQGLKENRKIAKTGGNIGWLWFNLFERYSSKYCKLIQIMLIYKKQPGNNRFI